mmetsp:Transcript_33303/g.67956  ORF Transcript_33303/g.67956 Transcript_33303/m.67956 type:complete len:325 (-) Transcript_33303:157-1131(-)
MGGKHDVLGPRYVLPEHFNETSELPRHVPSGRVGDVERRGPGLDDLPQDPVQELRIGPPGVLRAELDVLAPQALRVGHGVHCDVDHLVRSLAELRFHVYLRRRYEGVNARPPGALHGVPGPLDVLLVRAGQAADDGHVPVLEHLVPHDVGDLPNGVEVVGTRYGKTGLDDVHAELGEHPGDLELLGRRERRTGTLLSVAEGGVEDADVVGIGNLTGHVLRAGFALVEGGVFRVDAVGDAGGGGGRGGFGGGAEGRADSESADGRRGAAVGGGEGGRRRREEEGASHGGVEENPHGLGSESVEEGRGIDAGGVRPVGPRNLLFSS